MSRYKKVDFGRQWYKKHFSVPAAARKSRVFPPTGRKTHFGPWSLFFDATTPSGQSKKTARAPLLGFFLTGGRVEKQRPRYEITILLSHSQLVFLVELVLFLHKRSPNNIVRRRYEHSAKNLGRNVAFLSYFWWSITQSTRYWQNTQYCQCTNLFQRGSNRCEFVRGRSR